MKEQCVHFKIRINEKIGNQEVPAFDLINPNHIYYLAFGSGKDKSYSILP